jgi:arginase
MKFDSVSLVVSDWEYGAATAGTSNGPDTLIEVCSNSQLPFFTQLPKVTISQNLDDWDVNTIQLPYLKRGLPLLKHMRKLADSIESIRKDNNNIILLSGDHSNAVGGIAGFCRNINSQRAGVVWIDAHLDLHSPYTSPSGNVHGMALNTALQSDNTKHQERNIDEQSFSLWREIKSLKNNNCIPAANIVFIGIRSFEEQEEALVIDENIKVIYAHEIHENGIEWAISEAHSHLQDKVDHVYVSFDVDSLDPEISRGTGTPVDNGLQKDQAIKLLSHFYHLPQTEVFEITEINPSLDSDNSMCKAVCEILSEVLAPE